MATPSSEPAQHDRLRKLMFSHQRTVADLLNGYIDRSVVASLRLETLERCNGSYVTRHHRERHSDIVWRVRSSSRPSIHVYILLEFQSTIDPFMAARLMGYVSLTWQHLIAQKSIRAGQPLPPVLPIVLYNGSRSWMAPDHLPSQVSPALPMLSRWQPHMRFALVHENRARTSVGLHARNVVAALFALEQSRCYARHLSIIAQVSRWLTDDPLLDQTIASWYLNRLPANILQHHPDSVRVRLSEISKMPFFNIEQAIRRRISRAKKRGEIRGERRGLEKGTTSGEARGRCLAILRLVATGLIPVAHARAHVSSLAQDHLIPAEYAAATLKQLR